jgi:hypothetical protein
MTSIRAHHSCTNTNVMESSLRPEAACVAMEPRAHTVSMHRILAASKTAAVSELLHAGAKSCLGQMQSTQPSRPWHAAALGIQGSDYPESQ